jgi:hypothetical protein
MVAGEFVALLATTRLPVTLPADVGSKLAFKVAVCPGARTVPENKPLALKPVPEVLTLEIVTLELPEFVTVTAIVPPESTSTLPKLRLIGLALNKAVAAFTVRVALLLVTVPTVFFTVAAN